MNVSFNTNNFAPQYNSYKKTNSQAKQVSFTSELPRQSLFLKPFHKGMDNLTEWLAKNYTARLYQSKLAGWLANHSKTLDSMVDHMQVLGSVVITGMYMFQTLMNKSLDDDKKKTLAINQGLTFAVSTLGSYLVDSKLDNSWEKLTRKYLRASNYDKVVDDLEKINLDEKVKNEKLLKAGTPKKKLSTTNAAKYLKQLVAADEKAHAGVKDFKSSYATIASRVNGMGTLKKLLVFGTIYRFISPVAVTPIANAIGNKYIYKEEDNKKA